MLLLLERILDEVAAAARLERRVNSTADWSIPFLGPW